MVTTRASANGDRTGLSEAVENHEQELIIEALKRHNGNQRRAARDLCVTERILGYKVKKYGISPRIYTFRKSS